MVTAADEQDAQRPQCGDTGIKCPYTPWCGQPGAHYSTPCAVGPKYVPPAKIAAKADAINPAHYKQGATEVIDFIREQMGDLPFVAYCNGNAIKYLARVGKKDDAAQDFAKASWYAQMAAHTLNPDKYKDPRS